MPTVKDELGNKVAEFKYTPKGEAAADKMVAQNPGYTISDAGMRSEKIYAGGGKTGYNVPKYKHGGKASWRGRKEKGPKGELK
tara:strand:+ start:1255 stop:1503 length:249 start_codon:yes stop_codon:yes gene_type:complete